MAQNRKEPVTVDGKMICPACGKTVASGKFCLECGWRMVHDDDELRQAEKRQNRRIKQLAVLVIVAACLGIVALIVLDAVVQKKQTAPKTERTGTGHYGEIDAAEDTSQIEKPTERTEAYAVGDSIYFGTYEQDNDRGNGKEPIEWIVLAVEDHKALVLSRYALDCGCYHTTADDITWEQCALRGWLNGTFRTGAFTDFEQDAICTVDVSADANPKYRTSPGNTVRDKIFLLSIAEVERYFPNKEDRLCYPTAYAISNEIYYHDDIGTSCWWLRTPGDNEYSAARVYSRGEIDLDGDYVDHAFDAIRPAMWVDLRMIQD